MTKFGTIVVAMVLLGACSPSDNSPFRVLGGAPSPVPEEVAAIAAPYQDVQSARLREEDGCYWYVHSGPVETTLLPLRTVDGRPICRARQV